MIITEEWDGTEEHKQELVNQHSDLRLKEEQRHLDGNWLIFTDEPYVEPEPPRDLEKEVDELKARVSKMELVRSK
ncbi:unnamed protein product [marine sediment metagenome]|uniref:Uncharacterized protein n=1 Tax=marine sediment metagenome TaxID=412755 RepID=X1L207_9ZZZZ